MNISPSKSFETILSLERTKDCPAVLVAVSVNGLTFLMLRLLTPNAQESETNNFETI